MVTTVTNDSCHTYFGKSTDTKPTNSTVGNGSQFIEQDTGKLYFYDQENKKWIEFKKFIGGGN